MLAGQQELGACRRMPMRLARSRPACSRLTEPRTALPPTAPVLQEGLTGSPEAGSSFAEAMAALVGRLKAWRPQGLAVSVAPYSGCWAPYRALLAAAGDHIDYVNWQARVN